VAAHNLEIARIFGEIADLLEIKQESLFRINAYRKGARALESLSEDVAAIAERGELRKISGIGASLAEKIEEYLRTGAVAYHTELQAELPRGLADLMTIPEVGPKTARLLFERLGAASKRHGARSAPCSLTLTRSPPRCGRFPGSRRSAWRAASGGCATPSRTSTWSSRRVTRVP